MIFILKNALQMIFTLKFFAIFSNKIALQMILR